MAQRIGRRDFLGGVAALGVLPGAALAQGKPPEWFAPPELPPRRLSETLAEFVTGFELKSVPPLGIERARLAFIDTVGVMLAGTREHGNEAVRAIIDEEGAAPRASVVGQSYKTSPQLAALANGFAAHVMDYDFSSIMGQPTAPIIPALLPLAELNKSSPAELMSAFIVGFEVCMRMARATPNQAAAGGWHAVGTIGTTATAMACARLLKIPAKAIADIVGISVSMASSVSTNFGTQSKPLHAGLAARNGILAALLGARGLSANPAALEGPSGYYRSFSRGLKVSYEPFADLGKSWDIVERGFKPKRYPCGGLGHTAIDAALELSGELQLADVASVKAGITRYSASRIGDKYPTTGEAAKFSMPFVAAYTLIHGAPKIETFTEAAIHDERVRALAQHVSVAIDPEFAEIYEESPSRVTVTLKDGNTVERMKYYASGTPQNPLTQQQVLDKFTDCAAHYGDRAGGEKIFGLLQRLETLPSLDPLWVSVKKA